jgi:hypothetical protein
MMNAITIRWKVALSSGLMVLTGCSIPPQATIDAVSFRSQNEWSSESHSADLSAVSMSVPPSVQADSSQTETQIEAIPMTFNAQPFHLEDHQWQNRILLIFAPSEQHPSYQQQLQQFEGQEGELIDRELLVVHSFATGNSHINGLAANRQLIESASTDRLRQQFSITPDEFAVILIGKDGTPKREERSPISLTVVFDQIDTMPMRQREMWERGQFGER